MKKSKKSRNKRNKTKRQQKNKSISKQQNEANRKYFDNGEKHGINSFKLTNINKQLGQLIDKLELECLRRLKNGINFRNDVKAGIKLSVEAPPCCINYAELNIDRKVPLRQYFGQNIGNRVNGKIHRWCYGIGSGSSTVGGDLQTTVTKPLTSVMSEIVDEFNNMKIAKCMGQYCSKDVAYNHVTILYYLVDKHKNKVINLKKHCDLEVTATNKYKDGNSQKPGTPTIVISLGDTKTVKFYKRYANESKFDDKDYEVGAMEMESGEVFVLHPRDERVYNRRISLNNGNDYFKEERKSQFRHGVKFDINTMNKTPSHDKKEHNHESHLDESNDEKIDISSLKVAISVCFRQSQVMKEFCSSSHLVVDNRNNEKVSDAEIARQERMNKKRKTISNKEKIIEYNQKLNDFYDCAVNKKKNKREDK